jgi:hypothetical protein
MRFKTTRIVAAIAVIGAVAAGGAAFTDSNTQPTTSVAGYGTTSVTGGTVTSLTYALSSNGADINTATIVWSGDTSLDTTVIGFNGGGTYSCGTGTFISGSTTFTCDLTTDSVTTAAETVADIALTGPSS